MINSFDNYLKLGKAKKKTPDPEEAKALINKAIDRLEYLKIKGITEKTAKFILEDAYKAVRESAQSLMSIKGFKPYSHEATISFIKQFYSSEFKEEEIYDFDKFRQLRNNSIYKAVEINIEDAKSSIIFAKNFIQKVNSIKS